MQGSCHSLLDSEGLPDYLSGVNIPGGDSLMHLNDQNKRALLQLARESILSAVHHQQLTPTKHESTVLQEPAGAFVTLRSHSELRGCIGYIEPKLPLVRTVEEVAAKAALEDPRFHPLTDDELDQVDIEISVLSPLQKVDKVEDIEVGKHGLVVDAGFTRGLLLPQVAEENHWDRETFIRHTAMKAGLVPEGWNHPSVQLFSFTVDKFSESELTPKHH